MAVSVATLIAQAKILSDKTNDASIDDTNGWLVFVNRSVESLWRLIVSLDPEAFFAQGDFTLTGGVGGSSKDLSTVSGLTGFRALHGLDIYPDTANRRTVPRRGFRERNIGMIGLWIPSTFAIDRAYDLRGRTLNISPYEAAGGPYRAYARVGPYQFTSIVDANPLDYQFEPYAEYIEIRAARRALGIEESDTGPLANDLAEVTAEVTAAHTRDDGAPPVIADVEDDDPRFYP